MSDDDVVELLLTSIKSGNAAVEAACIDKIRGERGVKLEYRKSMTRAFMAAELQTLHDFAFYLQHHRLFSDREIFIFLSVRGKMRPAERFMTEAIIQEMWGGVTISRIILLRLIDARIDENAAK